MWCVTVYTPFACLYLHQVEKTLDTNQCHRFQAFIDKKYNMKDEFLSHKTAEYFFVLGSQYEARRTKKVPGRPETTHEICDPIA